MKKSNFLYIICFCAFLIELKAQHELGVHFMDSVYQSSFTNPAFHAGSGKTSAMLPSIYGNFMSPYSPAQLTTDVEGKRTLSLKSVYNAVEPVSRAQMNFELQTFGLALGFNKMNISIYHKYKAESYLNISKDLIGGLAVGNQPYLGKVMDLGSGFTGQVYSELGLGFAYKINDKISVGARVKKLAGFASVATKNQKLTLLTDSTDYSLTFNSDFEVHTYDINRFESFADGTYSFTETLASDNKGLSFDVGGTLTLDKLKISASATDIAGAIKWRNGAKTYSSQGTYTYSGEKSDQFLSFDGLNTDEMQDTIKKALNIQEGTVGSADIKLPMKTYLSAAYDLTNKIRVGGLIYTETWGGSTKTDILLSSTFRLAKQVHLGATYAIKNSTYNNLGVNFVFNLSSFQLYGMTDNILSIMNSAQAKNVNFRLGINLNFN